MAGIIKRGKTWAAIFYLNGKRTVRSTGVKIEQHGYTKHQLKTMAQQQAERLEALAKGDAVREGLLTRSPWTGVKLPKNDTAHHEPFTREEVRKLLTDLPSIWQDMVKLCIYTGGQRIGDVDLLR
ncbi:MAG: hypothetical protein IJN29_00610 [Akkermansia sp.]|nr:hypothetical protein [Akkermansia sp.]